MGQGKRATDLLHRVTPWSIPPIPIVASALGGGVAGTSGATMGFAGAVVLLGVVIAIGTRSHRPSRGRSKNPFPRSTSTTPSEEHRT